MAVSWAFQARIARSPAEESGPIEAPTILVVEDEWLIRTALSDDLRSRGYRVIEARDADEALAVLRTDFKIDGVVTDVVMPGTIDGVGLAQWIGRERPALHVILATAVNTTRNGSPLDSYGRLVSKPYDFAEIVRIIRAALATRQQRT